MWPLDRQTDGQMDRHFSTA